MPPKQIAIVGFKDSQCLNQVLLLKTLYLGKVQYTAFSQNHVVADKEGSMAFVSPGFVVTGFYFF